MNPPDETRRVSAWRVVVAACLLNAFGSPLEIAIGHSIAMPAAPPLVSSAVGIALALALWLDQGRVSTRASSLAFLLNSLTVAVFLWIANSYFAARAVHWVPYQANKLAVLVVVLLSPKLWVGGVSIALYAGGTLVTLSAPRSLQQGRAGQEPGAMVAYSLFAAVSFGHQDRRRSAEWAEHSTPG